MFILPFYVIFEGKPRVNWNKYNNYFYNYLFESLEAWPCMSEGWLSEKKELRLFCINIGCFIFEPVIFQKDVIRLFGYIPCIEEKPTLFCRVQTMLLTTDTALFTRQCSESDHSKAAPFCLNAFFRFRQPGQVYRLNSEGYWTSQPSSAGVLYHRAVKLKPLNISRLDRKRNGCKNNPIHFPAMKRISIQSLESLPSLSPLLYLQSIVFTSQL